MSFLSKVELKKQLRDMGIKVEGNYVRKGDIEKIIAGPVIDLKTKNKLKPSEIKQRKNLVSKEDEKYLKVAKDHYLKGDSYIYGFEHGEFALDPRALTTREWVEIGKILLKYTDEQFIKEANDQYGVDIQHYGREDRIEVGKNLMTGFDNGDP